MALNSSFVMLPKNDSWPNNHAVHSPHMIRGGANGNAQIRQKKHVFYGVFILVH